jgi:hypothetical protein
MARRPGGKFQVSHSEMATYKECKRRWFLQYYMRLKRKRQAPRVAADTGVAVHAALHQYYVIGGRRNHEKGYKTAMQYLKDERASMLARDLTPDDIKDINEIYNVADIVTKGYFEWLDETGADDHWTVQGSEERLVMDGPVENTEVKGFIDLWGEHSSGDLVVMDTKVVASIGDALKTLHLNEQGPLYGVLMRVNNPDARGLRVIWNMIKRNKQTARAKPPFYQRYELAINPDQLAQFYAQLHGQLSDMLETERRLNEGEHHVMVAYPNPTRDCSWKCPYIAVCGAMQDARTDYQWILDSQFEQWGQDPLDDSGEVAEEIVAPSGKTSD